MDIVMLQEASGQLDHTEEQTMALRIQVDDYDPPEPVSSSSKHEKNKSSTASKSQRPISPTEAPVVVRGNLHKLGKRLKGWHQRYFEVQGSHMYYYKNSTKKDLLGEINLEICYFCKPTSAATFGHPFELRTSIRSHTFAARTSEEMHQWVQVIQSNMCQTKDASVSTCIKIGFAFMCGVAAFCWFRQAGRNTAAKPPIGKPKRWETFKSTFSRPPAREKVNRKKSFADRFKIKRSRSPTPEKGEKRGEIPHSKRPLSFTGDEMPKETLEVLADIEVSHSLPNTPLIQKRKATVETPTSPVSLSSEDPLQSPALTLDSSQHSTPSHDVHTQDESRTAFPQLNDTASAPTEKFVLPEILLRKSVWDEVREVLDTADYPSKRESYSELPPEQKTWLEKPSGIEQLRSFLQVCP